MKNIILILSILILSACGIDKESPPPLSSVNNSGELDITFNGNGYLSIDNSAGGSGNDEIYDIAVDSADRIIAVGSSVNGSGDTDLAVWRLTSNGLIDTSFSGDGVFTHDNAAGGSGNDIGYSVVIGSSNEIYVTGTSINAGADFDMVIWKLTSAGVLDTSFAGTGFIVDDSAAGGSANDQGAGIALDASNKIVVTGFSDQTVTNRDMAVWRLTTAAVLDTTFSGDGIFTHDSAAGGEDDNGNAVVIDSTGNIIVAGVSDAVGNIGDMAIWKITTAGILDTAFNGTGFFTQHDAAGGANIDAATDIVIDSAGRYYVTGYSKNSDGNNDMVLWKLRSTGSLDTTFNAVGFTTFDVSTISGGSTNDTGEALIIDSEDRITVVGSGNENMCVWRYNDDGTIDENFNTDGFFAHDSAAGGFSLDSGTGVAEDSLNRLYMGGFSENDSNDYDATFWRMK